MTAAGESHSKRDLFDWQFRLIYQQVTRPVQPPIHDVSMWWNPRTLAERSFEVANADPGKRSQRAQFDRLIERILNVLQNKSAPAI